MGRCASAKITAQNFDTGRKIVTFSGAAGAPLRWASGISPAQKALIDPAAATANASSSDVLNYLRGDFSKQTNQATPGPYRTRSSVLGDIIHSTPVHWSTGGTSPVKTVFVGANDGMLHAINAVDGTERFAYIPSVLMPRLAQLSNPAYTHKYYVDGRLDVSNFLGGSQTILAGALGGGGKGLFALDVTNAAATSETDAASKILWEITNTGINSKDASVHSPTSTTYANLGYTYGAPTLLTLPDGKKALVVGNGYNNTGNGHASLFLINAATGALIKEIDTGVGTVASPNGLSTPTFWDTDGDGVKDTAYAGDIDGDLWKFSLVGPSYSVTKLHTTNPAHAITTAPSVMPHPLGGYMVNFVTGRMLTPFDKTDTSVHSAYGIWDGAPATNQTLLEQVLTEKIYTSGTTTKRVRTASSVAPDWKNTHKGWQVELPVGGERLVGDGAVMKDGVFYFLSSNPTIEGSPPGANWWMKLNALTGGDNTTVLFDLDVDGAFGVSDQITLGTDKISPVGLYFGGGIRSQLIQLSALGYTVFQANYDKNSLSTVTTVRPPLPPDTSTTNVVTPAGNGVSGGHFDEDIYYGTSLTAAAPSSKLHHHEYDDTYDVTGVNMLNSGDSGFNLVNAIPLSSTQFKVLAQNQYLSPAVSIHIKGNPAYIYNVDAGYIPIKNFITSATLDVTDVGQVPTYNRNSIQSLAINMPVDAFAQKDWWGGALGLPADVRVGLHPTKTGCVKSAAGSNDGNMYQPVNPPATVTATGVGTLGYSGSTTPATATGVRHNGALVIQIIKAGTPNSAVEMSVPGKPQYGWRVKSALYSTWVLAEYTTFWHHPNGQCYSDAGWTKLAPQDLSGKATTVNRVGNDPKIGVFGGTGTPVTVTPGTVTFAPVVTSKDNGNGTTTTTTVLVTVKTNTDGTKTTTTTTNTKTTYNSGSEANTTTTNVNGQGLTTGGSNDGTPPPPCIAAGTCSPPPPCNTFEAGACDPSSVVGRINWRELNR